MQRPRGKPQRVRPLATVSSLFPARIERVAPPRKSGAALSGEVGRATATALAPWERLANL